MEPGCYVDIKLRGQGSPVAAAIVLRVLHGVFRHQPGQYALALPDFPRTFPRMRVFAQSRDELDRLVAATENHPTFKEMGLFGYPKQVPQDFQGPWVSYQRYRIPSRKAERKPDGTLRLRRILAADEAKLPYFSLRSDSNGNVWRLYVEAVEAAPSTNLQPDGYGLATTSKPFGLPSLP